MVVPPILTADIAVIQSKRTLSNVPDMTLCITETKRDLPVPLI